MAGYPSDQGNPTGALPVYQVASSAGGWDAERIAANGISQVKAAPGTLGSVTTGTAGTTSSLALYDGDSATVTITIASPGVVTWAAHGKVAGDAIKFATTGALPTGLTAGTTYYVLAAGLSANTFRVSATPGGAAVNTSVSQSGVQTAYDVSDQLALIDTTALGNLPYQAAFGIGLIAIAAGGAAADVTILFK